MAETMRGMRLGSRSLETSFGAEFASRTQVQFRCPNSHEFQLVFAADAELPQTWECKSCDEIAIRLVDGKPLVFDEFAKEEKRSHFDMVLERRSRAELEELLEEMLEQMRQRRASGKLSA